MASGTWAVAAVLAAVLIGFQLGAACAGSTKRRIRADLATARRLAERDALTGLINRIGAQRHHSLQASAGTAPAAVLIDLDGFKSVNDTWGHQTGDAHLTAIAQRLAHAGTRIGALACRLAGDEFLLLVPFADAPTALEQTEAVLAQLSEPISLNTAEAGPITTATAASAGIALPEPGDTWADLLRRADIALYRAKIARGHAVIHTHGMQQPRLGDTRTGPRLREAVVLADVLGPAAELQNR